MNQQRTEIPGGYAHITELAAAGWDRLILDAHAEGDDRIRIETGPSTSPYYYSEEFVARLAEKLTEAEREQMQSNLAARAQAEKEREEAAAAEARRLALIIPRGDERATAENTISLRDLRARGWTRLMIDRYLAEADHSLHAGWGTSGYEFSPERWLISRVEAAEAKDTRLGKRVAAKLAEAEEKRQAEELERQAIEEQRRAEQLAREQEEQRRRAEQLAAERERWAGSQLVHFPYTGGEELRALARELGGRWEAAEKAWRMPADTAQQMRDAVAERFEEMHLPYEATDARQAAKDAGGMWVPSKTAWIVPTDGVDQVRAAVAEWEAQNPVYLRKFASIENGYRWNEGDVLWAEDGPEMRADGLPEGGAVVVITSASSSWISSYEQEEYGQPGAGAGWHCDARARLAAEEEAAEILAERAWMQARGDARRLIEEDLEWNGGAKVAQAAEGSEVIDLVAPHVAILGYYDEIRIEPEGTPGRRILYIRHRGADGDTWREGNYGWCMHASWVPHTEELAAAARLLDVSYRL